MKVILLAPTPPPAGGIAGWTMRMVSSTLKNGWDVIVVDEKLGDGRKLFGNNSKKNYSLELKRCFRIWKDLKRELKDPDVKVVHSCIPSYTLSMIREYVCACISKAHKRKFIVHFRCTVPNSVKTRASRFMFKRLCNISDRIFLLNSQSAEFAKGFTKTPVDVIPNFVDSSEIIDKKEINDEVKKVVYVGGVIETKGCADVIEVARSFPDITFYMVGSASQSITDLARGADNVVFTGVKDKNEVKELLDGADVFIFLSYFLGEGFSNALVEAMARGLPCLVTDWAANADMIENKGGCVVSVRRPDLAVEAMKKMLSPKERQMQSEFNIKKCMDVYSDKAVLSQYVDSYEKTINK